MSDALLAYSNALESNLKLLSKKITYDAISPTKYNIQDYISIGDIENSVRSLVSTIRFEIINGNNQTAPRGASLPEAIVFRASIRGPRGDRLMLANLPVRLSYGDDSEIEVGFTDDRGEYTVKALAIAHQRGRGQVSMQINPKMYPQYYSQIVRNVRGVANFRTTDPNPVVVNLSITDDKGVTAVGAMRQISRVLMNNGVIVNEQARINASGTVSVGRVKTVDDSGSRQYLAEASIDLQFRSGGQIIGTVRGTGQGVSGRSELDAVERAYGNVSLNLRELRNVIQLIIDN
jgi:hypothetical protein